ncbi:hypothetical protein H0H92_009762 [Tricholoma furcatifolium]|nr:hypothetical protein H0H92_009762 [Tricholoma furcatifolium]
MGVGGQETRFSLLLTPSYRPLFLHLFPAPSSPVSFTSAPRITTTSGPYVQREMPVWGAGVKKVEGAWEADVRSPSEETERE